MFTSGSLVVLQNIQRKSQRFYTGHNESITCLTLHHSNLFAASGQQSGNDVINDVASHDAHIRVWSVDNLAVTSQFGHGLLQGTVKKVEFSKTNEWLATVDLEHLTLWHWRNETALSRHRLGNGDVSVTSFIEEDTWLVTAGKNYFHFWQVHDNGSLRKSIKSGIFDGDSPDIVTCLLVSFNGDVITGDSNGDVTFWRKDYDGIFSIKRQIHADAGIRCMWNLAGGNLVSAHEDGYVCSWDLLSENSFSKGKRKIGNSKLDVIMTSSRRGDDVLLCLSENCNLMQGTLQSAWSTTQLGPRSRVNGVAMLSSYTEVCTCDSTGMVACWDLACKEKVWCTSLESETLCLDVHFDFEIVLLGCKSSSFIVLSSRSGERVCSRSLPAAATCVKFDDPNQTGSPYVAVATDDRKIQIFLVLDFGRAYVLQSSVPFHSGTIVEMDWSNDARFLRVQSKHHDVMIYDVTKKNRVTGQPLTSSWRTNDCSDDVSITCQASFGDVSARCAVGGIVQLFRKKELLKQFKCSSSDITSVCMTSQYVVLGGGSQVIPLLHLWELE
ncbi:echinoderm microtubule-associated protein-like 1 [Ciona intestinalis]